MKGQFIPYKDENVTHKFPIVNTIFIALNIIVFLYSLTNFDQIIAAYGFVPADFALLTLFTSMFLHGGLDHLFGNMLFLHIFGDNVEDKLGRLPYLAFYLLAGIAAAAVHFATDPSSAIPTIGASGAISGVLGAYLVFFPKVKVRTLLGYGFYFHHTKIPASLLIGFWFVMQLVLGGISLLGERGSGIAFFAHIGGFVFGYVLITIVKVVKK